MIFGLVGLAAMVMVVLCGGSVVRLALLRFRAARVLVIAYGAKFAIMSFAPAGTPNWLLATVHDMTYAGMLTFFWLNRKIPGMLIILAGTFSNGFTIAINGGRLPAMRSAIELSGLQIDYRYFTNTGLVPHAKLAFLGDIFYIPAGWPMANIFSIGDIIIAAGAAYCIVRVCGTRWNAPVADLRQLGGFDPSSGSKNPANRPAAPAPLTAK